MGCKRYFKKLLIEVLGYNNDEIKIMIAENFGRNIVNNLVIEQAKYITEIFGDNDFQIYLNDGSGSEGAIAWKELGITLSHNPPKAHYCDKPLVSREYLADMYLCLRFDNSFFEISGDKISSNTLLLTFLINVLLFIDN